MFSPTKHSDFCLRTINLVHIFMSIFAGWCVFYLFIYFCFFVFVVILLFVLLCFKQRLFKLLNARYFFLIPISLTPCYILNVLLLIRWIFHTSSCFFPCNVSWISGEKTNKQMCKQKKLLIWHVSGR